ncbi:hypothetical protein FPV67DRAFT_1453355 [Lyophyllum atratum]|nr:hypothetical protein FPV67DRAFT_1453355 [Lyophyllum atratum]
MPANTSKAISFVANPTTRELERVVNSPFLKTLFHGAIGSFLIDYAFTPLDIVTTVDYGVTHYSLEPQIATALWSTLTKLAQVIQCAAWDHNPFESAEPLPVSISLDKLHSIDLAPPILPLVLASPERNPLLDPFECVYDVKHRLILVQHITMYYVRWLAQGVERSLKQGLDCQWNWGAYWGLSWEEFVAHVEEPKSIVRVPLPAYNAAAVDNSLALILHPTLSSAAIRANEVLHGKIPIKMGPIALPIPFHTFYTNFTTLFL